MRPDGAFDRVRVHFDAAVVKERDQAGPVAYGVTYGLGQPPVSDKLPLK
jgi:hypothetical protein